MIQRIQSVYLSLIIPISIFLLNGSFLIFSEKTGAVIKVTHDCIFRESAGQGLELIEKLLPLYVLIILIPIVSLITIFVFKKRNLQMRLALFLITLCFLLMIAFIYISINAITKQNASIILGFKMIVPIAILVLSILAYLGIRKDEKLVKSYDRLR